MTPLNVGVIGLGVGEQHAIGFRNHADCTLAAVCDFDAGKRSLAEARYPEARFYTNADDLLENPEIDLVAIASYDDHHAAQILKAIANGKHVFAEKPLCLRPEDTAAIRSALAEHPEVRLTTNTILRMSPRFVSLREEILAGHLGHIYHIEADYNYGRLWKLAEGWRGRIPGYSVMLGGGIHMVDLVLWLTGDRCYRVRAVGNDIASRETCFTGKDLVVALLEFRSGLIAKIAVNFGCVESHFHRLTVYGTQATFENGRECAFMSRSRDPAVPREHIDTAYPGIAKYALIPSFVDAVLGRGNAVVSETDVFAAMAVCHAIDRSVAQNRATLVDYE